MPMFELCLLGHGTGLACALATRLEDRLPFAAFKMAHPLETQASVILEDEDDASAAKACSEACAEIAHDLRTLLSHLPPDPCAKESLWPERRAATPLGVAFHRRQISREA